MVENKMAIQDIAEKILRKNGIDPDKGDFYLKLQKPGFDDLVIERCGPQVFIGHYHTQEGDLIPDPVLVMDFNKSFWYPERIEQVLGEVTVSFMEDGKRMIYPERVKEFKSFQKMFARNIKEQGWLNAKPQTTVSPGGVIMAAKSNKIEIVIPANIAKIYSLPVRKKFDDEDKMNKWAQENLPENILDNVKIIRTTDVSKAHPVKKEGSP